jgi:hypothetical protein
VRDEFVVHGLLIQFTNRGLAAFRAARAVIDTIAAFVRARVSDHDAGTCGRIARQQDRMAGLVERRVFEREVIRRIGACRAFTMYPSFLIVHDFAARNVVADEIHELATSAGNDFLERFKHKLVDEHVVHGREVCTERHVVNIIISLLRAERSVNQFAVVAWQRNIPGRKLVLQGLEKQRYAEEIDYKDYEKKVQKLIDTHVHSEGIQQVTPPVNIFERDAFKKEVEKLESAASKADTIAHRTQRTITEKMDEDPVFYRRFGRVLQDTIDDYRNQRINENEYLNKVSEVMQSVLSRTGDQLPEILRDRDVAKPFYGVVNETLEGLQLKEDAVPYGTQNFAAGLAVQIDDAIERMAIVDWRTNMDVQNQMRNVIDDLLYEARTAKGVPLTPQDMDGIIERALDIAKSRYPR